MSFKDVYKSAILKADVKDAEKKTDDTKSKVDAKAQQIIDDQLAKSRVLKSKSK